MLGYNPTIIESQAQKYWDNNQIFRAKETISQEKFYCLSMLPYPSGELHMGHVRNYTLGDAIAHYQRMQGKNVLHPMGWDAFGLPAENAAIKHRISPEQWTRKNIEHMRQQMKRFGFSYDWSRELCLCQPSYYHWEQWLFLHMYKKGLAYRKNAVVNWDPVDQTVLANEQVIDGRGWRSNALIERRTIPQWFFKITDYAEQLLHDLDKLKKGWPEPVLAMQRRWIGRSEGVTTTFQVDGWPDNNLHVYTSRIDTLMGVTFLALAPQHELCQIIASQNRALSAFIKACQHIKVSEADIAQMNKEGVFLGIHAIHPITQAKIPIWTANFVLSDYAQGAVMGVPAHDQRDFEFAQKYNLPIQQVVEPTTHAGQHLGTHALTHDGRLVHSGPFTGLTSEEARKQITDTLVEQGIAKRKIQYRLRDWCISRQRYWGTPIPIIYCPNCGIVPVPEQDLPITLPSLSTNKGASSHNTGLSLKQHPDFYTTRCPNCQQEAKRETDTFDTFFESSWYYARYASFDQKKAILDNRTPYWCPVDYYIGGIEHATMHLLYARFIHKILRDAQFVNTDEPFLTLLTQGMVLKEGKKMSKSTGNTVSPQVMIDRYGADTVRLFCLFAAPPEHAIEWNDHGIEGAHRFLKRLWDFCQDRAGILQAYHQRGSSNSEIKELISLRHDIHQRLKQINTDMQRSQLNTVVSGAMKLLNLLHNSVYQHPDHISVLNEGLSILLRVLTPITPHITHHLWQQLGYSDHVLAAPWPKTDSQALKTDFVTIVIQINGKRRAQIDVPIHTDPSELEKMALAHKVVQKHLGNRTPIKIILVPQKLINIVVTPHP